MDKPVVAANTPVKVELKKGDNPILVKVVQKAGNWGFCMQLKD